MRIIQTLKRFRTNLSHEILLHTTIVDTCRTFYWSREKFQLLFHFDNSDNLFEIPATSAAGEKKQQQQQSTTERKNVKKIKILFNEQVCEILQNAIRVRVSVPEPMPLV